MAEDDQDDVAATGEEFDKSLLDHAVRCWDAERENASRLATRASLVFSVLSVLFGLGLFRIDWLRGEKDVPRVPWEEARWVIRVALAASLVVFGIALFILLARSTPRPKKLPWWRRAIFHAAKAFIRLVPPSNLRSGRRTHSERIRRRLRAYVKLTAPMVANGSHSVEPIMSPNSSDLMAFPEEFFDEAPPESGTARQLVFNCVYEAYLDLRRRNALRDQHIERALAWFIIGLCFVGIAILVFLFLNR